LKTKDGGLSPPRDKRGGFFCAPGLPRPGSTAAAYNALCMPSQTPIDQISERVNRLLVHHEELLRANQLLQQQVEALRQERDLLRLQSQAVRQRLDALIEQLPTESDDSRP